MSLTAVDQWPPSGALGFGEWTLPGEDHRLAAYMFRGKDADVRGSRFSMNAWARVSASRLQTSAISTAPVEAATFTVIASGAFSGPIMITPLGSSSQPLRPPSKHRASVRRHQLRNHDAEVGVSGSPSRRRGLQRRDGADGSGGDAGRTVASGERLRAHRHACARCAGARTSPDRNRTRPTHHLSCVAIEIAARRPPMIYIGQAGGSLAGNDSHPASSTESQPGVVSPGHLGSLSERAFCCARVGG